MLGRWACERRGGTLRVSGIEHGDHDILKHCVLPNHDVIVLVRWRGRSVWSSLGQTRYAATTYEVLRLVPINANASSWSNVFPDLPREERPAFEGWYRCDETIKEIEPGRDRKAVAALKALVDAYAAVNSYA